MKRLLVILLILFATHLQAQVRIEDAEAYSTAELFVSQQGKQGKPALTLSEEIKSEQSRQTNLYVFSMQSKGFVIVSALNEVLAYSFASAMPASAELPDHIAYWLDLYNQQTDYLIEHPEPSKKPTKSQNAVEPLLTSIWGQGCYHNAACPFDTLGPCQHVEAGCVAIAMAQIMYYHKQPLVGNGTVSYNCPPYGTLSADFGQTTYQWEDMTDTLHESNPAVAQLIYHCGVSVEMKYGAQSSLSSSKNAVSAFQDHFGYQATSLNKANYSDEEWVAMIKKDLNAHLPLYYEGSSSLGRHAFVCDGYDNNGLFHFNFGWDGVADGYYTLESPYGFSVTQSIIRSICQEQDISIHSDEHGIIYVTPDGTGDGSSWDQATSELQLAIIKSHSGSNSIWVKEGSYTGVSKDVYTYNITGDCQIYGGFEGNEPFNYDLSLRDFNEHPSILDGNNLRGVINVSTESNSNSILIDGFIIQNGNTANGGGIITNNDIQVKNCTFRFNHANSNGGAFSNISYYTLNTLMENCEFYGNDAKTNGGAIIDCGNSIYLRCQFHDNFAKGNGGAVYCRPYRNHNFTNCVFSNNTAQDGGGIYNHDGNTTLWSCLISNNTAKTGGGGYSSNGLRSIHLFNCTIVKNEAQNNFGGIYAYNGTIKNCIIWGNESQGEVPQIGPINSYSYCVVQNDQSGSELNFNAAAENDGDSSRFYIRFKSPDVVAGSSGYGGDWRLQLNSCCIDKGVTLSDQTPTDLDGNPRIWNDTVDLGAYEVSIINLEEEICESDTYDFFGTLLYEAGHYSTTIGCNTYELDLNVNPLPVLHCSSDTIVELGQSVTLTASGADTYHWSTGETTESITITPLMDTSYSVTGFSFYGCSTTAHINVRVNNGCEELNDSQAITLYPNPADSKVEILLPNIDEVDVFGQFGEHIVHVKANREAVELDVSQFANEIYIVRVKQLKNLYYYHKLIVVH